MPETPWTPGPWQQQGGRVWTRADTGAYFQSNYHKDADARLIAAAPEMAELLAEAQRAEDIGWSRVPLPRDEGLHSRIVALLARVRGEA